MSTEGSISEILNETEPKLDLNPPAVEKVVEVETPEAEPPEVETPQAEETPTEATGTGEKEPDGTPPPAEEKPELPQVPIASLHDERRKRQELERRLAAMEQQKQQTPAPDPIEDPEGFMSHQDAVRQSERLQDRILMSEQIMRTNVGDDEYEKAQDAFAAEVETNPALAVELRTHPNPAKFAFDTGKAALERQEIGNPREFAARQVEEALAKQKATMAEEITRQVQEQLAKLVPKSLADAKSEGTRSAQTPVDDVDVPIEQLLPKL